MKAVVPWTNIPVWGTTGGLSEQFSTYLLGKVRLWQCNTCNAGLLDLKRQYFILIC